MTELNIVYGSFESLLPEVRAYVTNKANLCRPDRVHICDGSPAEFKLLIDAMERTRTIKKLDADRFDNCWLVDTDVRDIARVESKTFICTKNVDDTVPETKYGALSKLGNWMSVESMDFLLTRKRFPNSMAGRTMYVIPFSMGPVGSPLSKIGIQLTDSAYVVTCTRIMTRVGKPVLDYLQSHPDTKFIRCLHSVGRSIGMMMSWPCDPDNTVIAHFPERNEICSYGSGYGGNSLLGKKCFALRIASTLARDEGWLAEHMLILGITNPEGKKKFIAAAFPSACGKTNLAMLQPTLPGWKVECVGDDIAWMRYDDEGNLRGINPEAGFFGVAPGTSMKTNPYCMKSLHKDTVFTNVAYTSDGGVYWEGMDEEVDIDSVHVTSWDGRHWTPESSFTAAHKNSRFCTPANHLETIDPAWEDPKGVPIAAILFGGRRPDTVPLVFQSFDWTHGVFVGSSMRSMTTAASLEGVVKRVQHDPFAMRPFFGYNFGHYVQHWLDVGKKPNAKLPKIFHVNWFRTEKVPGAHDHNKRKERYLWPGFGENCRVLEWIFRRTDEEDVAIKSPIGYIPKPDALSLDGLHEPVKVDKLFAVHKDEWMNEVGKIREYFDEQIGSHMPKEIVTELDKLEERVKAM